MPPRELLRPRRFGFDAAVATSERMRTAENGPHCRSVAAGGPVILREPTQTGARTSPRAGQGGPREMTRSDTQPTLLGALNRFCDATARRLAIALVLGLCGLAVSTGAYADSHIAVEAETSAEAAASPPPGTLGPQGVVPQEGVVEAGEGKMPLEPIGHVPGPGEGVYGDPPNTGGTENPEGRGWAYDTDYFFAMTRGLKTDTDLGPTGQRWVRPWTLTFDVVTLPTAALAGLSGRAPAEDQPARDEPTQDEPAKADAESSDGAEAGDDSPDESMDSAPDESAPPSDAEGEAPAA